MPRSKRKAVAADFVKKKPKLGRKARAENYTETNFRQRQIHVPNQTRAPPSSESAPRATGLPLVDLLSRTRHHNASTRIAALNALANALTDENAAAHTAVRAPGGVVAAAAGALSDETGGVRAAARALLVKTLREIHTGPFAQLVASQTIAALSHIRTDVRLDAARALVDIVAVAGVAMFKAGPLEALSDLLGCVQGARGRAVVLEAVASVCEPGPTASGADGTEDARGRFYYHRALDRTAREDCDILKHMPLASVSTLVTRIANIVTECMPLSSCVRDATKTGLATFATRALAGTVSGQLQAPAEKAVNRVLTLWQKTPHNVLLDAQNGLARVALARSRGDLAARYVVAALADRASGDTFDACVVACVPLCDEVAQAWAARFEHAAKRADTGFLRKCMPALRAVLGGSAGARRTLEAVPAGIRALGRDAMARELIVQTCDAWRRLRTLEDAAGMKQIAADVVRAACEGDIATEAAEHVAGLATAAGVLTEDYVVAYVGRCVKAEEWRTAESFLAGLEWCARQEDSSERLRAIAVGQALSTVGGGEAGSAVRECLDRILEVAEAR